MKTMMKMLACVLALTLVVTSLSGFTLPNDKTADVDNSSAVSNTAPSSEVSLTADVAYVGTSSTENTIKLTLSGGTFKNGISADDIRLDNAFKHMSIESVSATDNTLTLKLNGVPCKNADVNIYEFGKVVVLASGINDADSYAEAKIEVVAPYLGIDAKSIKVSGGKITADVLAYDMGDIDSFTKDNITIEGAKVVAAEKKDDYTVAVTLTADGVETANDFAKLVNGKKIAVSSNEAEIYLPETSVFSYLDYCAQDGDNLDITLDLYATNGAFADDISVDMVSFGEDFKGAKAESIKLDDNAAKLTLTLPSNGMTPENFRLYGEVKLSPEAVVNTWGEAGSTAVSDMYFFKGSAMDRDISYQPSGTLDAQTLLDIQAYTRGLNTSHGTVLYWGSVIGGGLSTAYSIGVSAFQACGFIESEHVQVMKQLAEINAKIDKMQDTLDQQTQQLLQIQSTLQKQKLNDYYTYSRNLNSSHDILLGKINQAKRDIFLTTWIKGEPLPDGYRLTDADGNEIASDDEIPDDYKILDAQGAEVTPQTVIDPETATDEETAEYNATLLEYIYDKQDHHISPYDDFDTQLSSMKGSISNLCGLINSSGSGVGNNPFDEFDAYCAMFYNFDSQSYLPRVMFRESAVTALTQSMALLAVTCNLPSNQENADYITYNKWYHAAIKKIDNSVPSGQASENIRAYPHGEENVTVSTGKYISNIKVSGTYTKEAAKQHLLDEGYTVIDKDLNENAGGLYIYLGYKTTDNYDEAIKDMKIVEGKGNNLSSVTINNIPYNICPYIANAGQFTDETGDLNCNAGGKWLWLYYTKTDTGDHRAVESVFFDSESDNISTDNVFKTLDKNNNFWDLNASSGGDYIFMYQVKDTVHPMYIREIMTAAHENKADAKKRLTDAGFTVIDQDTNKGGGGDYVYVGYKTTTDPEQAIKSLYIRRESKAISPADVVKDGVTYSPVTNCVNLNSNSGGKYLYLYYTKEPIDGAPLKALWFNDKKSGSLQEQDLNMSADGDDIYLHYCTHPFTENQTRVMESDALYHPYCYTLGAKVTLLSSGNYPYSAVGSQYHRFTDDERNSFINKMTNNSLRDELFSAGLLRDETLFSDLRNQSLAIKISVGNVPVGYDIHIDEININNKTVENIDCSTQPGEPYNDKPFIAFYTYDTDYSVTLPVNQDYAECVGVEYKGGELSYYMDLGDNVKTKAAAYVKFEVSDGTSAEVTVSDATEYTNTKNGDKYYKFSFAVSEALAESTDAKFYFDEFDCFDLPKYTGARHTVTWKNWDGTVLETDTDVRPGTDPEYNGDTPTRPEADNLVYTFTGWDPDVKTVTGNATYTAQFSSTVKKYTVTFVNDDGTELQSSEYEYGETPEYTGETPTKQSTAQYIYTFNGWDNEITAVTGDTTYTATYTENYVQPTLVPEVTPYINENGEYQLGTVEHYVIDGKNYAVNSDDSIGDELSNLTLSYFDFSLLSDGTYQILHYTGPYDDLDELVIPKSFNSKAITVLGDGVSNAGFMKATGDKKQFKLKLNENITEIKPYAFYAMWVSKVYGDTSALKTIGNYAFSWANSPDGYTLDITFGYEGTIICGPGIFNNMKVTANLKHATKFSKSSFFQQSITYNFTDAHTYGEPTWTWADDCSSATATFTCTDSRCKHEETVNATLTFEPKEDVDTYTATVVFEGETYTDTKDADKKYFTGHSLSLTGDIGVNFYINLTEEQAQTATVVFRWTVENNEKTVTVNMKDTEKKSCGYKATCPIAVAEMTYDITATLTIGDEEFADTYSAVTYGTVILTDEDFAQRYIAAENQKGNDGEQRLADLQLLVKTMLNYGAKAQVVFKRNTGNLANKGVDYTMADVSAEDITTTPSDMDSGLEEYGLEYQGSTIVYLTKTSMRHYYKITDQDKFDAVKDSITFGGVQVDYTEKNGQIYFEHPDIAAADLDESYTLTIGENSYDYSVLDYVRECLSSPNAPYATVKLVMATYWYNQAANTYFGR